MFLKGVIEWGVFNITAIPCAVLAVLHAMFAVLLAMSAVPLQGEALGKDCEGLGRGVLYTQWPPSKVIKITCLSLPFKGRDKKIYGKFHKGS